MQKVSILYVITKLELGGAQKQLLRIIRGLDRQGNNVFLFTAQEGPLLSEALAIKGLKVKTSKFLERPVNPIMDLLALCEIYNVIKKNNIDIVHTHSSKAGILGRLAAKLTKAKVIIHTVHGWSFNDYQLFFLRWLYIWLERLAAQFSSKLIVVSHFDKEKGLRNNIGDSNKYALIRYGIKLDEFNINNCHLREELRLNRGDLAVGMVSCFKPQKAPQDFIKLAFLVNRSMPGVKFILVGDGILGKELKALIVKFNLQKEVILLGWRNDIPRILSALDVFVLSSLWEGLPVSVLEAMASSLPVVATNTGGIAEALVEGKAGFLVPPRNIEEMAEKLTILLKDENLRRRIGRNARDFLEGNFHLEDMLRDTRDLYENLIKKTYGCPLRKGVRYE